MFLPHRVDVTEILQSDTNSELEIEFESAFLKAREIRDQHPDHKYICFNGDSARLAVRKAQYHWGWDWGPLLVCAGIWKPIRMEIYAVRVADLRADVELSSNYRLATIQASIEVEGHEGQTLDAKFTVRRGEQVLCSAEAEVTPDGKALGALQIPDPELWMPNGYGGQGLYEVSVDVVKDGLILHSESRRIGMRKVELVQEHDTHGKSFYFRINGVDVFCGGSCWIPADSFLTNVTRERYRAWLELMVPANQKMIR